MHFRLLLRIFPVLAFLSIQGALASETVVEDSPSRLVLEIVVDGYQSGPSPDGSGASRVSASGFLNPAEVGAPDLPWLRFQVATGDRMPVVTVEPLEWTDVALSGGLAGSPRWISTTKAEPARNEALFAAARGINPAVSAVQVVRGLKLRDIALPIASYSGGSQASLMKKFRVRVEFPNPGSTPAAGVREWLEFAGVKNPRGGVYLTALPRPTALARRAATQATTFDPEAPRIKISIGDRELDGFDEDGVYALTYAQVASVAGTGVIGTPVSTLRMFTGPQDTLRVRMDSLVPPTLTEIPIEVRDANANTTFDPGDTIFFYAHGTSIWKPAPGALAWVHWQFKSDPWSFENRYYLQWGGEAGARLATAPIVATPDTVTSTSHYLHAERDLLTGSCDLSASFDAETGFAWNWFRRTTCTYGSTPGFGAAFPTLPWSQLRRPSTDSLPGRVADTVLFGFFLYGAPQSNVFTPWSANVPLPYVFPGPRGAWYMKTTGFSGNATGLDSVFWGGGIRFEGYSIQYVRSLAWSEGRMIFPAVNAGRVAYKISGAPAGMRVLRIQEGNPVQWLAVSSVGGGAAAFSDSTGPDANVRYLLYTAFSNTVPTSGLTLETAPGSESGILQDLREGSIGGVPQDPEYLIIAPTALLPEAVQLRNYREAAGRLNPMATSVVRVEDVYREWSSGRLSPVAIRDMLRWAVNRWGSGGNSGRLKYVVLFGDGHYDYRNILNGASASPSPNHIPPFNWLLNDESLNPMNTDDFYGVIDSGGDWLSSSMAISIGRLPFKTRAEAATYLTKISRYENPANSGEWRGRVLMTADDQMQGSNYDGAGDHTGQAETLGTWILSSNPGMRTEKIYLLDYLANAARLKPEATQDLINQYNRGTLFSTFFGHGAYNQMADEVLLKTNDGLSRIRNPDKNFFMTLFSCTVGRFEKLADEGMSEQFLRQKDYGAIGTVSASRETYSDDNSNLGYNFVQRAFASVDDTVSTTVGTALRLAKVAAGLSQHEGNKQKYILQGEPVLLLRRPGLGLQLTAAPDTLQSQGCDSITGRVTRGSGRGAVSVRIVSGDVPKTFYTGAKVQKRGKILFERTVPYVDSTFALEYFIPRDVPFGDSTAKIQIFAWDSLQLRESSLLVSNLRISGTATSSCMVNDQRGPRIAVSGCNSREAGQVDFSDKVKIGLPYCLQISVSDTGGGVQAGDGPDQGTTVQVVGSIAPYQPQAGVDELALKTYQVTLSKQDIPEGNHLLKISARDGFGNLSQRQITLQVSQDTALTFVRAFNVPNPLKRGETTFWFSTTLPDDEGQPLQEPLTDRIRFHVRIFNQSGYMVQEFRDARSGETRWNGKDAWGRTLANGVYFYDVTATWNEGSGGPVGGRRVSRKNTLVISR